MSDKQHTLRGVEASGVMLTVFGFFFLIFGAVAIFQLLAFGMQSDALRASHHPKLFTYAWVFGIVALCAVCFIAGSALQHSRRWAAYTAMCLGAFLLTISFLLLRILVAPYAPGDRQGEDGFIFMFAAPCFVTGAWLCIYLNLPHVRRHLRNSAVAEPHNEA